MAKTEEKSPFIKRIEYEIDFVGLRDKDSDYEGAIGEAVIELAKVFAGQGHSGYSAQLTSTLLYTLIQGKSLTALTTEPGEWLDVSKQMYTKEQLEAGEKIWQNIRDEAVFSKDGGKTWENMRENTKGESVTREEALYGIGEEDPKQGEQKVSEKPTGDSRGSHAGGVHNRRKPATKSGSKKSNSSRKKSKDVEGSQQTVANPKPADS